MGTNYYLRYNFCKECERYDGLHIGKSSAGWKFMFHYIKGKAENMRQWGNLIKNSVIVDEYGREVDEFFSLVNGKQKNSSQSEIIKDYTMFREINGFDFMEGEFS